MFSFKNVKKKNRCRIKKLSFIKWKIYDQKIKIDLLIQFFKNIHNYLKKKKWKNEIQRKNF